MDPPCSLSKFAWTRQDVSFIYLFIISFNIYRDRNGRITKRDKSVTDPFSDVISYSRRILRIARLSLDLASRFSSARLVSRVDVKRATDFGRHGAAIAIASRQRVGIGLKTRRSCGLTSTRRRVPCSLVESCKRRDQLKLKHTSTIVENAAESWHITCRNLAAGDHEDRSGLRKPRLAETWRWPPRRMDDVSRIIQFDNSSR